MSPFNNKWIALLLVAGILLVVTELVGTPGHEGVLARYGVASADTPAVVAATEAPAQPAQPAPVVVEDPDSVLEDEEEGDEALGEESEDTVLVTVDDEDEPAPDEVSGSTVSSEPPGPPGVFTSGE